MLGLAWGLGEFILDARSWYEVVLEYRGTGTIELRAAELQTAELKSCRADWLAREEKMRETRQARRREDEVSPWKPIKSSRDRDVIPSNQSTVCPHL